MCSLANGFVFSRILLTAILFRRLIVSRSQAASLRLRIALGTYQETGIKAPLLEILEILEILMVFWKLLYPDSKFL